MVRGMQRPAAALAALLLVPACSDPPLVRGSSAPIVAGVAAQRAVPDRANPASPKAGGDRPGLSARLRGLALLDELGCTACHDHDGADPRPGPDLETAGARLRRGHLRAFIGDPLGTEPGTAMPDLLRDLERAEHDAAVAALVAYIETRGSDEAPARERPTNDPAATARGERLWGAIGCVQCHRSGDDDRDGDGAGALDLAHVGSKYRTGALTAFLLAPHAARPGGRMPDFGLTPAEASDLAAFLRGAATDAGAAAHEPDGALVAQGRRLFAERGCVACHDVTDAGRPTRTAAQPLAAIAPTASVEAPRTGCLSGLAGPWPFYALTDEQRTDITAALTQLDEPLTPADRAHIALASRNCTACHIRATDWTIDTPRRLESHVMVSNVQTHDPSFRTNDPTIGQEGRLPPPLTGIGGKLQADWLRATIAHGQRERPYLQTRMPGFGDAFGERLAAALTAADEAPKTAVTPLPKDREEKKVVIELGKELTGDRGMNCIACHTFAGEQAGSMAALDLVATTGQRLRPEWFAHFLRSPFSEKPNTLMPQFFPDGRSTRPEIGGGDVQQQIDGLWHYLAEGRNVRKPRGLRRPPIVLQVEDEAVMLRRALQHTGKRGIAVGYPGGVNIAFDAETLGMDQVWWGEFLDAGPVWRGQGSGRAHPRGKPRVTLPKGPAFVVLENADAPWPEQSRRELGHEWFGYDLDDNRRPAFRYAAHGVTIVDVPRERAVTEGQRPHLERRLLLSSAAATRLTFRAARHADIEAANDRFLVGPDLAITVTGARATVQDAGEERELRLTIDVPEGDCEVVLTYEPRKP